MNYQGILFDLDGTLTASGEGITKSVQYALKKMGRPELGEDLKKLEVFVGPPLLEQFMAYAGFCEKEAKDAVRYYRERYNVTGIFENKPYPGIEELLGALKKQGLILAVASSKPDPMVKIVLEHFHLDTYFDVIRGSDISRPKMTKAEVILQVLGEMGYGDKRDQVIMVGDRHYDVLGAKETGLSCIGVTYGYGTREELLEAGAIQTADSAWELEKILLHRPAGDQKNPEE